MQKRVVFTKLQTQLTARRGSILRIIVGDYVEKAVPVGSEHIAKAHPLGVSSATIRNEMAALEDDGFITHPHTSAGRIPSDKGYRYYVESLMVSGELPSAIQQQFRSRLAELEGEVDRWTELAASLLAQMVEAVAVITLPSAPATRFRHLELVALQEFALLVVLVFQEARVRQHLLHLEHAVQQEELTPLSQRLSAHYAGKTALEIAQSPAPNAPLDDHVTKSIVRMMETEDQRAAQDLQMTGLRHLLGQPEFASSDRLSGLIEVVDDKDHMVTMLPRLASTEGVSVVIGSENPDAQLREFSIVISPYGVPGQFSGTLAVLGPTRMRYGRTMATVGFLARLMSEHLNEHLAMS
ncbi:MAG: heat-inducible transcription repressor HrcA [Dehalococcoidia bacterium]|nr:heat-inducible transcription repressor HrcA [Dehalococcoidia bacterium]